MRPEMEDFAPLDERLSNGLVRTNAPDGLTQIRRPETAAALWDRQPMAKLHSWIDGLTPEQLPATRMIIAKDRVCDALIEVAEARGTPDCKERDILIEDASALAAIFADIMRVEYLRLRLDVI